MWLLVLNGQYFDFHMGCTVNDCVQLSGISSFQSVLFIGLSESFLLVIL